VICQVMLVPLFIWMSRASEFPRDYDGACLQMRLSYSPAAHIFLFLVQWTDCSLAGALGLLRILIYKVCGMLCCRFVGSVLTLSMCPPEFMWMARQRCRLMRGKPVSKNSMVRVCDVLTSLPNHVIFCAALLIRVVICLA